MIRNLPILELGKAGFLYLVRSFALLLQIILYKDIGNINLVLSVFV